MLLPPDGFFGLAVLRIPKLRDVFRSKLMRIVMGVMCPFQCWISMNGMQTVFADMVLWPLFSKLEGKVPVIFVYHKDR